MYSSARSWDFLHWLLHPTKVDLYEKTAAVCLFVRGLSMSMTAFSASPAWKAWQTRKKKKKSKEENMWEKLTRSTAREFNTKVGCILYAGIKMAG